MKLKKLGCKIEEFVGLGKDQSGRLEGIKPAIWLEVDLEEGDDIDECSAKLYKVLEKPWALQVLKELSWVIERRSGDDRDSAIRSQTHLKNQIRKLVTNGD